MIVSILDLIGNTPLVRTNNITGIRAAEACNSLHLFTDIDTRGAII